MNNLIEQLWELRDEYVVRSVAAPIRSDHGPIYRQFIRRLDAILPLRTVDWRDQIPWSALRSEVQWVMMSPDEEWYGFDVEPQPDDISGPVQHYDFEIGDGVAMPDPPTDWRESKVRRPEGV